MNTYFVAVRSIKNNSVKRLEMKGANVDAVRTQLRDSKLFPAREWMVQTIVERK